MIRSILLPLDGSPAANSALKVACSIGGIVEAQVVGLFVEDTRRFLQLPTGTAILESFVGEPQVPQPLPPEQLFAEQEKAAAEAEATRSRFEDQCKRISLESRFVTAIGVPGEVIIQYAREVDLIVIGSIGKHSETEKHRAGLTTLQLLRSTTRPVLVVPDEPFGESTMLVAYDGSPASERVLRVAAELCELADLQRCYLLTVGSDAGAGETIQRPAREYLARYDVEVDCIVQSGRPDELILAISREVDASIVALGAFGKNRLMEQLFGSTTEAVLRGAETAVLLIS